MKKKLISMVLSVFMVVSLFCGTYFAVKNISGFDFSTSQVAVQDKDENVSAKATPSGTWADAVGISYPESYSVYYYGITCHIQNETDLACFMMLVNNEYGEWYGGSCYHWYQATVYLDADLDMSAHYWSPMKRYIGYFYGQGHTIDGVYINWAVSGTNEQSFGLFGKLASQAYVEGVAVRGDYSFSLSSAGNFAIGGIAGSVNSSSYYDESIINCTFDGSICVTGNATAKSYIGGIVGVVYKSKFEESAGGNHSANIKCCTNYARIELENGAYFSLGGIVARCNSPTSVYCCTNLGLFCKKSYPKSPIEYSGGIFYCFGGIVGAGYSVSVFGCVNYSSFSLKASDKTMSYYLGGIVGAGYDNIYIEKCINYGNIKGADKYSKYVGGIAGRLGRLKKGGSEISADVYGWKDSDSHTNNHCYNCVNYGHIYGSNYAASLVGYICAAENALAGCRVISNALNGNSNNMCYYPSSLSISSNNVYLCNADGYSSSYSLTMSQTGNWTYCSFDSYGLKNDKGEATELKTMSDNEMTWTTAAKNYLDNYYQNTINGATIVNIKDCSETIVPSAALRRFKLELKWTDSSGTRSSFNSASLAYIQLKNANKSKSCTYAYVYHLKGAAYASSNFSGKWSSLMLFSIWYNRDIFTFSTFEESPSVGRINKFDNGKFDFKNSLVARATGGYKALSYFGVDNENNPPTITAVFTAKTQNVTFNTYFGSPAKSYEQKSGLGVIKTGTTYGGGSVLVGSSSSSGTGAYSYLATISANITPTLGYYLYSVEKGDGSTVSVNYEYSSAEPRGRARINITNYQFDFDTLEFYFVKIPYSYRLLCSWDGNSELSRVDNRWCIGNTLTGADNTEYSADSIPTQLQYGWTYCISAVVFGNGDDITDTHNLTYNANNQGCIDTSGASRRIGFDGVLSSFTFDENAFYLACGNIDFVLERTARAYKINFSGTLFGEEDSSITGDRGVKFRVNDGEVRNAPSEIWADNSNNFNVAFQIYPGYTINGVDVLKGDDSTFKYSLNLPSDDDSGAPVNALGITWFDSDSDPHWQIGNGSTLFQHYLAGMALTEVTYQDGAGKDRTTKLLTNEADFGREITIQFVLNYKTMELTTSEMQSVKVEGVSKENLATNTVAYFNVIEVTARDPKQNEKFLGIYSGDNLLTTESTYTFLVDANYREIGSLSIEAKFTTIETALVELPNTFWVSMDDYGYYIIDSAEKLVWVRDQVNSGAQPGMNFKIDADIDMKGVYFEAIGTTEHVFTGKCKGQNHTISNIYPIYNNKIHLSIFGNTQYSPSNLDVVGFTNNILEISTAKDLIWFSEMVNAGSNFSGYIVRQTQDIDMSGKILNPIGSTAHPFCGVYDGQNHIISNLNYSGWNSISYVGFFGKTQNAVVKNLTIKDSTFTGYNYVGVFAAEGENTTFENVNAYNCTLSALHLQFYDIYGNEISKCESDDTISVNYIRPTTIETQGKTATSRLAQSFRQTTSFGGFVGKGTRCNFVLASYINGTHTNELGSTIYAFVGSGSINTFDRCCALTQFLRSVSVVCAYHGGTFTDVFVAQKNGSSISVLGKKRDHSSNWITINDLEVLKDFYWYFN